MSEQIKGIEQGRASFAFQKVEQAMEQLKHPSEKKEYKAYLKKIPMLIKTNGLGATFAFVKSKGGATYDLIYKQTTEWLKQDTKQLVEDDFTDLSGVIVSQDSFSYRALTIEILALFGWLRRFAEGQIETD